MRTILLTLLLILLAGALFALIGIVIGKIPNNLDFKVDRTHFDEED